MKSSRLLLLAIALPAVSAFAQTASTITGNISNALVQNDYLWIESHFTQVQFQNAPANFTAHVWISAADFSFTYNSVHYDILLPAAELTFSSSNGSTPTLSYSRGYWQSSFPASGTQNPFATGVMYQVPTALNGFTIAGNGASLTESFSTDYSGGSVSLSWQWSAAQYTQSKPSLNDLGVTPGDNVGGAYGNYHSGTPTAILANLVAGGTGGGGSNFTGSNSGTASVTPAYQAISPISLQPVPEAGTWAAIGAIVGIGCLQGLRVYRKRA
ncbi:MAG TPA: hypothetical protein VMF06_06840 [Candidatus Limnocylindria bacterium]|jgi:hypothetical protein|nr:hypothetical protein [Candidatus Limnocylindria bacterium]